MLINLLTTEDMAAFLEKYCRRQEGKAIHDRNFLQIFLRLTEYTNASAIVVYRCLRQLGFEIKQAWDKEAGRPRRLIHGLMWDMEKLPAEVRGPDEGTSIAERIKAGLKESELIEWYEEKGMNLNLVRLYREKFPKPGVPLPPEFDIEAHPPRVVLPLLIEAKPFSSWKEEDVLEVKKWLEDNPDATVDQRLRASMLLKRWASVSRPSPAAKPKYVPRGG